MSYLDAGTIFPSHRNTIKEHNRQVGSDRRAHQNPGQYCFVIIKHPILKTCLVSNPSLNKNSQTRKCATSASSRSTRSVMSTGTIGTFKLTQPNLRGISVRLMFPKANQQLAGMRLLFPETVFKKAVTLAQVAVQTAGAKH
jgi:hypothetical protein